MILPGSYANGFAPRDGRPLYPELWRGCVAAIAPCLGPTGVTVRDWSPLKGHGTLTSASMQAVNGGRYAISTLAASSQTLDMTTLPGIAGQPSVTIACSMRRGGAASQFHVGTGSSGSTFAGLLLNSDNNVYFMVTPNFAGFANSSTEWQHVALTLTGSVISGYVNGIRVLTTPGPSVFPTLGTTWQVGRYQFGNTFNTGFADDFRAYNRALLPQEIRLLASRPGISYEIAPRRRSSVQVAGFNRRRRLLIGASS